jgi:hypothetical protein
MAHAGPQERSRSLAHAERWISTVGRRNPAMDVGKPLIVGLRYR